MTTFISIWLICSIIVFGMLIGLNDPKLKALEVQYPGISQSYNNLQKGDHVGFWGKALICAGGPMTLGIVISFHFLILDYDIGIATGRISLPNKKEQ